MKLKTLAQSQYFDSSLKNYAPIHSKFECFTIALANLLSAIDENESEGYNENLVQEFLQEAFYKPTNLINKKDRKDLVIYGGLQNSSKVEVLLEVKKPNSSEMISEDNPNKKALQQLLYYFLRERVDEDNGNLKRLIATDAYNWFIFDAALFEKAFYQNNKLIKDYKAWRDGKKSFSDTSTFYKEIAEKYIDELETLECVHINIKDFEKLLDKTDKANSTKLTSLYKLFSPKYLLKKSFLDDNNELKPKFYNELLHIIGLEEKKEKNKLLIKRKSETNRNSGSLLELAIAKLETEYPSYDFEYIQDFGETQEERIYEIALELCLTWINRILFLKLLEAQLVSYHQDNKDYKFLNTTKIPTFNELYKLFHNVLATKLNERLPAIQKEYSRIPYLNSSLFDFAEVENETLKISGLDDGMLLEFIGKTALKDEKKNSEGLDTLDYLFKFLDKHDFSTVDTRIIRDDDRTLINASVLGKVFEKINGYKDGAVFTPAFITMYMCRQAIRLAVLQKFKDETDFNSEDFEELKIYIGEPYKKEKIKEYNRIIDSLKLCDPAVGSGHFLVSALNEIIAIKSELNILASGENKDNPAEDYKPIREYKIIVSDDELDIRHKQSDEVFRYEIFNDKPTEDAQFIQKTLFHEKQKLIENSLFGVDINPNSVKICRLRLWIELLKNAYYRPEENFTDLETLPNIDINIKEGNSLISRFSLDENLSKVLKKAKLKVKDYRDMVRDYKETRNPITKKKLEAAIKKVKTNIKIELHAQSKERMDLIDLQNTLKALNQKSYLFGETDEQLKERLKDINQTKQEIQKQEVKIREKEENKIFEDAFEWRFEFPEVLNDKGKFLGFDVVIANPPYVLSRETFEELFKKHIAEKYQLIHEKPNLYLLFIELTFSLMRLNGQCGLITPNSVAGVESAYKVREHLLKESNLQVVINILGETFKDFGVEATILSFSNKKPTEQIKYLTIDKEEIEEDALNSISKTLWLNNRNFFFDVSSSEDEIKIIHKIKLNSYNLNELYDVRVGLQAYEKGKGKPKQTAKDVKDHIFDYDFEFDKNTYRYLNGSDIERYSTTWSGQWLRYGKWLSQPKSIEQFSSPRILIREITGKFPMTLKGTYVEDTYLNNKSILNMLEIDKENSLKYLLAILNSTLISFYHIRQTVKGNRRLFPKIVIRDAKNYPIKKISPKAQEPFIKLVDETLEKKKDGKDTEELETKIDKMVYKLYELTAEEIAIVEGKD